MTKKLFITAIALLSTVLASAQIIRTEDLEQYAKQRYGSKWKDAAANLAKTLSLDKNKALTFTEVVEAPGKSKQDLYILLNYWFTTSFNDANNAIKLNDKESGTIIANGYVSNIAQHDAGINAYKVNVRPIIKTDIKDGKIRVTCTVQTYEVDVDPVGGITGALLRDDKSPRPAHILENWPLSDCYPFAKKDSHSRTSSKALIMSHAYSNALMDKIKEAVKNGLVGNEDEDW